MQIADGLERYDQFILYRIAPSIARPGKTDKFPIDYRTGRKIDLTNPSNWTTAKNALQGLQKYDNTYGVGFVFAKQDPFFFLDIDDCLQPNNTWSPLALSMIDIFKGAAVEVSSSGRGIHIFGCADIGIHGTKYKEGNKTVLEFYTSERFVALTGTHLTGSALTEHTDAAWWLVQNYFSKPAASHGNWRDQWCEMEKSGTREEWRGPSDDAELMRRMLQSEGFRATLGTAATFNDLYNNNMQLLMQIYGDESSIDAALAQHLTFWTGNDVKRMERIMWQSRLVRDKWHREDYVPRTIISACNKATKFLQDKAVRTFDVPAAAVKTHRGKVIDFSAYLNRDQQIEKFAGCTWVQDVNRILIPGGHLLNKEQFNNKFGGCVFPLDNANEKTTRNAWEAFTQSQMVEYEHAITTCFDPTASPGAIINKMDVNIVNMWWPVNTPRMQGDIAPFLNHIKKLLPNEHDAQVLLAYLAACVQHKGIKFQWAPFIQGVDGNGKSILTQCVAEAIGQCYVSYPKTSQIGVNFNSWMYGKILIAIEDIYVTYGQQEIIEALKPMISNRLQPIEPKGVDMQTKEICCNFIINSNHKEGLPKSDKDRRIAPFFTAQQEKEDLERDGITIDYLHKLHSWLRNENGFAIVSEFLHTYLIPSDLNPASGRRAPVTSSTDDAIRHGRNPIEQEVLEAIDQELQGFRNGWISSMAFDILLRRMNFEKRIPHGKRKEILRSLNYILHPNLKDGRVHTNVMPDCGKPRLYIRKGHPDIKLTEPAKIAEVYSLAQQTIDRADNNE